MSSGEPVIASVSHQISARTRKGPKDVASVKRTGTSVPTARLRPGRGVENRMALQMEY